MKKLWFWSMSVMFLVVGVHRAALYMGASPAATLAVAVGALAGVGAVAVLAGPGAIAAFAGLTAFAVGIVAVTAAFVAAVAAVATTTANFAAAVGALAIAAVVVAALAAGFAKEQEVSFRWTLSVVVVEAVGIYAGITLVWWTVLPASALLGLLYFFWKKKDAARQPQAA